MPALLLLLRFGKMPFPIPVLWFPVWLLLLPVALLAQTAGSVASLFCRDRSSTLARLSGSMALWSILPGLHGLEVNVSSSEESLMFRFI
ncbi:MAG: hypothetical protein R6V62_11205 [Candidatus Fermentibacteraceae bacterium]